MTRKKKDDFCFDDYSPKDRRDADKALRKAAEALWTSFVWEDSKEGCEYWQKVAKRLTEIADMYHLSKSKEA
jgi:hypothetical protein